MYTIHIPPTVNGLWCLFDGGKQFRGPTIVGRTISDISDDWYRLGTSQSPVQFMYTVKSKIMYVCRYNVLFLQCVYVRLQVIFKLLVHTCSK